MPVHAIVIDDDSFNLEVVGRLLGAQGATYTAIQDPTNIEASLDNIKKVDVVFLDLEMPKMDGYKAFDLLQSKLGSTVPIVACTVHTNEMETARELGFAGFVSKPLDAARFKDQLERIMNRQPVWDVD